MNKCKTSTTIALARSFSKWISANKDFMSTHIAGLTEMKQTFQ